MAFPRQQLWQWRHQVNNNNNNDVKRPATTSESSRGRSRTSFQQNHRKVKEKKETQQNRQANIPVDTIITNEQKQREDYLFNAMQPLIDGAWRRRQYEEHYKRESRAYLRNHRAQTSSPANYSNYFFNRKSRISNNSNNNLSLEQRLNNFKEHATRPATSFEIRSIMNKSSIHSKNKSNRNAERFEEIKQYYGGRESRALTRYGKRLSPSKLLPRKSVPPRGYSAIRREKLINESLLVDGNENYDTKVMKNNTNTTTNNNIAKHDFYKKVHGRKQLLIKSISSLVQNAMETDNTIEHILPDMTSNSDYISSLQTHKNDIQL